jgi:hypothetical protein
MVRRVILVLCLVASAFLLYANRHQIAVLAGLDSNKLRIQGDWYELRAGFKEYDRYTFRDETVTRNDETCGNYHFRSYRELFVTIDGQSTDYIVEFPDPETMEWFQEVKGELKVRRRWKR